MGMWDNFAKEDDNLDEISSTEEKEPIKLIDSVGTLVALTNRSRELSAEILSGIDKEQSLSKQLSTLNIDELNKAASKETTYKTEEEFDNAYMNQVLNHNNNDLFKFNSSFIFLRYLLKLGVQKLGIQKKPYGFPLNNNLNHQVNQLFGDLCQLLDDIFLKQ